MEGRQPETLSNPLDDGARRRPFRVLDGGQLLRHVGCVGQHKQLVQMSHHAPVCKLVAATVPTNCWHRRMLDARQTSGAADVLAHSCGARRDHLAIGAAQHLPLRIQDAMVERAHLLHEEPADQVQVLRDGKLALQLVVGWRRLDPVVLLLVRDNLIEHLVQAWVVKLWLRDCQEDGGNLLEVVLPVEDQVVPLGALCHPVAGRRLHLPCARKDLVDGVVVSGGHLHSTAPLSVPLLRVLSCASQRCPVQTC